MDEGCHVVLFVVRLAGGGVQRTFARLANYLVRNGWKVSVVALYGGDMAPSDLHHEIEVMSVHKLASLSRERWAVLWLFSAWKIMRKLSPDLVYTGQFGPTLLVRILRLFAGKKPYRHVVSVRSDIYGSQSINNASRFRLTGFLEDALRKWSLKADKIIANSKGTKASYCGFLGCDPTSIEVIYNPIVDGALDAQLREKVCHRWLSGEEAESKVIVTVARIHPQKDYDTLLYALQELNRKREVKMIVIGSGPEQRRIRSLANRMGLDGVVDFMGIQGNPIKFMRDADVFCLSSHYEGFGNVLVEALYAGTPVVATDCPSGPAEIITSSRLGFLVRPVDPLSLADALLAAMKLGKRDSEWRKNSMARRFSVARCGRLHDKVFREVLG